MLADTFSISYSQAGEKNKLKEWNMIFAQVLRWMSDFLAGSFNNNTFLGVANPWCLRGERLITDTPYTCPKTPKNPSKTAEFLTTNKSSPQVKPPTLQWIVSAWLGGDEPPGEAKVRRRGKDAKKKTPFGVSTLYKSSAPKEGTLLRNSETLGKELNVWKVLLIEEILHHLIFFIIYLPYQLVHYFSHQQYYWWRLENHLWREPGFKLRENSPKKKTTSVPRPRRNLTSPDIVAGSESNGRRGGDREFRAPQGKTAATNTNKKNAPCNAVPFPEKRGHPKRTLL